MKIGLLRNIISLEAKLVSFLLIALLLLDRNFSKLTIIGPIYAHDLVLFIATIITIFKTSLKFRLPSIFLIIIISILYLIYSVFFGDTGKGGFLMIFRQFLLFFYLMCSYIIANKFFRNENNIDKSVEFIKRIAFWSLFLQLFYFMYLYVTVENYSPLKGYSYLSALGVMGIITYAAYILVFFQGLKKQLMFLLLIVVSTLLGHASSFFAVFVILLSHFYISFKPKVRFIVIGIILLLGIIVIQLPQFNDKNASWRILYWVEIFRQSIVDNYLVLGNGFGKPYVSLEFTDYLYENLNSHNMLEKYNPMARWESPPHNSFLTIIFHVGLIPFLLLVWPLKTIFSQLFLKRKSEDKNKLFLFYTIIGLIVWSSFNVILELPHSAIFFWLIFFTYIFYDKIKI